MHWAPSTWVDTLSLPHIMMGRPMNMGVCALRTGSPHTRFKNMKSSSLGRETLTECFGSRGGQNNTLEGCCYVACCRERPPDSTRSRTQDEWSTLTYNRLFHRATASSLREVQKCTKPSRTSPCSGIVPKQSQDPPRCIWVLWWSILQSSKFGTTGCCCARASYRTSPPVSPSCTTNMV